MKASATKPRRQFLAGLLVLAAAPLGAQPTRQYRIGMLETVPLEANSANLVEFHKGLRTLGYEEGKTYVIHYRSADGRAERFPSLADELLREGVDVFVTRGTPATLAAMRVDAEVPIVAAAIADPVETGIAASLTVPGGKVTGLSSSVSELGPKRMELLKALAPGTTRIGALVNPDNPASLANWKAIEAAAPGVRLKADMIDVRKPEDLGAAIEAAAREGVDGLLVGVETLAAANQTRIIETVATLRLPAIYAERQFVAAGGLASYGVSYPPLYYRAAGYVDNVLKGARPAALAMGRPTKLEFVINRRTARALGVAIPPDLLLRSDDVVE
jgi:putative tryptophan/tyrosine transport system substrate-binding protein